MRQVFAGWSRMTRGVALWLALMACAAGWSVGLQEVSLPTPEQAAWLRANAVELRGVKAGQGFEDLEPLRAMIGEATVVGLGEGTHGTREHFLLKHRMLEFLVEEMGFSIFSIEANMPESYAVGEYVLGGEGDVNALIAGMHFWTWETKEVRDMVEWMRSRNLRWMKEGSPRRIRFTGFDMQYATVSLRIVGEFLALHDPVFAAEKSDDLRLIGSRSPDQPHTYGCVTSRIPVDMVRGQRVRLSGWIRTRLLVGGWAGLWLRVDGPSRFLDSMQGRRIEGDTDWTHATIETTVPADAAYVYFGLLADGDGEAWFDGLVVEVGDAAIVLEGHDLDFESDQPTGLVHAGPVGEPPPPGFEYVIDGSVAKSGSRSGLLRSLPVVSHEDVLGRAGAILAHMESSRERYAESAGREAAEWAIQNARVVHQFSGLTSDPNEGYTHRDRSMAENAAWIAGQSPGEKMVVWAHNLHVRDEMPFMGAHLRRMLGEKYVSVAICSARGRYTAVPLLGGALGAWRLQEPPEGSFESILDADGREILLVDLRSVEPGDAGSGWLAESRPFGGGTIGAREVPDHYSDMLLRGHFDVLAFVKDTTASRPIRPPGAGAGGGGRE